MRPLELRLRNFRSYFGEETVFDLRDRTLVGVVGPIGSGKSSLLDAIAFALYGRTPAGGSATRGLIHQRADHGGVLLRFEVEGEVWEAVRSLRRKGQSQHALYRYPDDTETATPVDKIMLEGEVNERIRDLLGLDFDAFGRSVLLAQGRFAEFLGSGPTARDTVLKGVFGHDRIGVMREIARRRIEETGAELGQVAVRVEQLDRVAERLEINRRLLTEAGDRAEQLGKAEPRLRDLDGRIATATTEGEVARKRLADLAAHTEQLPDPADVGSLIEEAGAVERRRRRLGDEIDEAHRHLLEAERAVGALAEQGEREAVEQAVELLAVAGSRRRAREDAEKRLEAATRRLAEGTDRRETLRRDLAGAVEARTVADTAVAEAEERLESARRAHHVAQHADMASTLRRGLAAGDPCPVCRRQIDDPPEPDEPAALQDTAEAVEDAGRARSTAESERTASAVGVAEIEKELGSLDDAHRDLRSEVAELTEEVATAGAELGGVTDRLAELLGDGDPATLLEEHRRRHRAIEEDAAAARRTLDQVRTRHDQAIRDEQEIGKRLAALRMDVVAAAARLDVEIEPGDDPGSLESAVDELGTRWEEQTGSAQAVVTRTEEEIAAAGEERRELLASLGLDEDLGTALAKAQARAEHLTTEIARDGDEIDAAEGLITERDRLAASRTVLERVATDLTDSRFVRFLLDDERARLAELGSDHFMRLSSGRYRFTGDGRFHIVDLTAADAVRNASSLSGGETFLASLALALALAEMVARTGGRLDAFFLDEGFGSLDPEHLDLAMEGIEALVADRSDRLVMVVSHVPELRHRIGDVIELDRHPLTGDTRVVRG